MSKKGGNKDKKGSDSSAYSIPLSSHESLIDEQKRQILQKSFMIKKMQDRIMLIQQQYNSIKKNKEQEQKKYEQKIQAQRLVIETHECRIEKLSEKIHDLELKRIQLQSSTRELTRSLGVAEETKQKEIEEYRKMMSIEIIGLETQLKDYGYYMKERENYEKEREDLKNQLECQKNLKIKELADKEREKVQANDRLKDEMFMKIKDMRMNLLSLKKEQLSTTTRIAVLQNHQLTGELEYQSKQTEKLIYENESLQKKIITLQKDIQIHKNVEEQLAKRSHFSRGVIKKLNEKVERLMEELKESKSMDQSSERKEEDVDDIMKKEETINLLDKELMEKQKRYNKLQTDYQTLQNEAKVMKEKLLKFQKKSEYLFILLSKYFDEVLEGKAELKVHPHDQLIYDIRAMRKKIVQDWTLQECKMVVNVLLNKLRPNLNKNTLGVPAINKTEILMVKDDFEERKLPRISEHSLRKGIKELPLNVASKIVSSNLREWGRTVHTNSVVNLGKKGRH